MRETEPEDRMTFTFFPGIGRRRRRCFSFIITDRFSETSLSQRQDVGLWKRSDASRAKPDPGAGGLKKQPVKHCKRAV